MLEGKLDADLAKRWAWDQPCELHPTREFKDLKQVRVTDWDVDRCLDEYRNPNEGIVDRLEFAKQVGFISEDLEKSLEDIHKYVAGIKKADARRKQLED